VTVEKNRLITFGPDTASLTTASPIAEHAGTDTDKVTAISSDTSTAEFNSEPVPNLLKIADRAMYQRLSIWFEDYKASRRVGDPIEVYAFVEFDDALIADIRIGKSDRFSFRISDTYNYEIVTESMFEIDRGWILKGYLPNRPDYSDASIIFNDNGSKGGHVSVIGTGIFVIVPTPELSHHLVYLKTGEIWMD
jgi:hypothetical protein